MSFRCSALIMAHPHPWFAILCDCLEVLIRGPQGLLKIQCAEGSSPENIVMADENWYYHTKQVILLSYLLYLPLSSLSACSSSCCSTTLPKEPGL